MDRLTDIVNNVWTTKVNYFSLLSLICDFIEQFVRILVIWFTNFLSVKVIRDDKGVPFLYRYHLFALTSDGPGMCIHRFVKSDPDRGYHDHPWSNAVSFILCGGYEERILNLEDKKTYTVHERNRFTFNYLSGQDNFHRVMIAPNRDAWTIFMFSQRAKTWGMIGLDGEYNAMSTSVVDQDGGWWHNVGKGFGINHHVKHEGNVVATVDSIVTHDDKILLIKRGKDPYKDHWAFPGGRIEQKDKDIEAAAKRELKEETNLDIPLKYYKTIGNSTRDPRGFCLTNIFICELDEYPSNVKAGDDAVDYEWFPLDDLPPMAFDHKKILTDFINE